MAGSVSPSPQLREFDGGGNFVGVGVEVPSEEIC